MALHQCCPSGFGVFSPSEEGDIWVSKKREQENRQSGGSWRSELGSSALESLWAWQWWAFLLGQVGVSGLGRTPDIQWLGLYPGSCALWLSGGCDGFSSPVFGWLMLDNLMTGWVPSPSKSKGCLCSRELFARVLRIYTFFSKIHNSMVLSTKHTHLSTPVCLPLHINVCMHTDMPDEWNIRMC